MPNEIYRPKDQSHEELVKHILSCPLPDQQSWTVYIWAYWPGILFALLVLIFLALVWVV